MEIPQQKIILRLIYFRTEQRWWYSIQTKNQADT